MREKLENNPVIFLYALAELACVILEVLRHSRSPSRSM